MERSEPTLVPEWLKGTGNATGGGATTHLFASSSSSSHSDEVGLALPMRNRSSLNFVDFDISPSSALLDRTSSSYFRRSSSSNGTMGHDKDISFHSRSYSSFGRSNRDRDYKDILDFRDKDRSVFGDQRDRVFSDADVFTSRVDKDIFRRSQSMISGKRGELRSRRVAPEANINNHSTPNGATGGNKIINIHKGTFERDFPSLGAEEKQGVDRVASPGLSAVAQSLPMGTSAMIMGNGWTSALAEVPVLSGSNSAGLSSIVQNTASSSVPSATTTAAGLNMAETLAQAPARGARTAPQLSVETQRLEELAIKQSRQLIPMTPSLPKNLALNSEKQKPKLSSRSEMSMVSKSGQQQLLSPQSVNHPLRGGMVRSDVAKPSNGGKLLVLKTGRENGTSHAMKDTSSPTTAGRTASNPFALATPSVGVTPKAQSNPKLIVAERKTSSMEKKPINPQAQSRNDFFNLMRKKTLANNSSAAQDPVPSTSATVLEKSGEMTNEITDAGSRPGSDNYASDRPNQNDDHGAAVASNGDASADSQRLPNDGVKHSCSDASLYPNEEEAAFLKSLGWEEDAGEEEGLTQEEINAFYQEYMKLRPSSKLCQGMHQSNLSQLESRVDNIGGGSETGSSH